MKLCNSLVIIPLAICASAQFNQESLFRNMAALQARGYDLHDIMGLDDRAYEWEDTMDIYARDDMFQEDLEKALYRRTIPSQLSRSQLQPKQAKGGKRTAMFKGNCVLQDCVVSLWNLHVPNTRCEGGWSGSCNVLLPTNEKQEPLRANGEVAFEGDAKSLNYGKEPM